MDSNRLRTALLQHLRTEELFGVASLPVTVAHDSIGESTGASSAGAGVPCVRASHDAAPVVDEAALTERIRQLRVLDTTHVQDCRKCSLYETRTQTVFGQGNPASRLVFVGEAPGYEEDQRGLAFVGRAGQLLTRMIEAMGLKRDDVFICNVLKCRPPQNRDPTADEIIACSPYLMEQLDIIRPAALVALGAPAAKTLLNTAQSIGRLRGRFHDCCLSGMPGAGESIPLMPTYHPAYLLRNPAEKRKTWEDLQLVMERLGLPMPS